MAKVHGKTLVAFATATALIALSACQPPSFNVWEDYDSHEFGFATPGNTGFGQSGNPFGGGDGDGDGDSGDAGGDGDGDGDPGGGGGGDGDGDGDGGKHPNSGGGNGAEDGDPGNSGNTPAHDNDDD